MDALDNNIYKRKISQIINKRSNTIGIELTTYCPLDCIYCTRKYNEKKDRNLSWNDFLTLYKKIENFERVVICGIGESLVYPYLYDVLNVLKNKKVVLITSGSVKIDYNKLKESNCIEVLIFSVDTPSEEGMKSIAPSYNWDNLLYNLKHARGFTRMINCTVTEENIETLPNLARFAIDNNLSAISYTLDIRRGKEIEQDVKKILDEARSIAKKGRLVFLDNSSQFKCVSWSNLVHYINIEGEVFPCCQEVNTQSTVGNIFDLTMDEIFAGGEYRKFKMGSSCFGGCKIFEDMEMLSSDTGK